MKEGIVTTRCIVSFLLAKNILKKCAHDCSNFIKFHCSSKPTPQNPEKAQSMMNAFSLLPKAYILGGRLSATTFGPELGQNPKGAVNETT